MYLWTCMCTHIPICVYICPSLSTYKTLNKYYLLFFIFPCGTSGKESACQPPRGGSGNPLQYSCLENSMDRGAWQATVHGVAKGWTAALCTYAHTFLKSQRKWSDQTPHQLLFWYITLVLFPHTINTMENAKKQQLEPDMEQYETSCQSRFDARYWMLGAGALGWPRGMVWGGRRRVEGSGWGTHVYLWRIHFDIWQN